MTTLPCSVIRKSIERYLRDEIRVSRMRDYCVLTMPIKTLDGRWVSVSVEQKLGDTFLVHDSGKTDSELFSQGMTLTDTDAQTRAIIAASYGVHLGERMIQRTCTAHDLAEAIFAVAQSAAMLTVQLIWPTVEVEVEHMRNEVSEALALWKPEDVRIARDVDIVGEKFTHRLSFVSYASAASHRNAGVEILSPNRPLDKAYRYGYTWLDMEKKSDEYKSWGRVVVIPRVEAWTGPAIEMIRRIATDTVEFKGSQDAGVKALIAETMSKVIERPEYPEQDPEHPPLRLTG